MFAFGLKVKTEVSVYSHLNKLRISFVTFFLFTCRQTETMHFVALVCAIIFVYYEIWLFFHYFFFYFPSKIHDIIEFISRRGHGGVTSSMHIESLTYIVMEDWVLSHAINLFQN